MYIRSANQMHTIIKNINKQKANSVIKNKEFFVLNVKRDIHDRHSYYVLNKYD